MFIAVFVLDLSNTSVTSEHLQLVTMLTTKALSSDCHMLTAKALFQDCHMLTTKALS